MKTTEENLYFHDELTLICACHNFEHQLIFWGDDEFPDIIYVHPHLVRKRLFKRIIYAVRYVFGYKSRFGAWDEFILDKEGLNKLKKYHEHSTTTRPKKGN